MDQYPDGHARPRVAKENGQRIPRRLGQRRRHGHCDNRRERRMGRDLVREPKQKITIP